MDIAQLEKCCANEYFGYRGDTEPFNNPENYSKSMSYHELYLQQEPLEFMFPVRFEDGMSYEDCEKYYASLHPHRKTEGCMQQQSRIPFTPELKDDARGNLRSCLRRSRFYFPSQSEAVVTPRHHPSKCQWTGSFSNLPDTPNSTLLTHQRARQSMRVISGELYVSFEKYIYIVTIYPFYEYPKYIWSLLWYARHDFTRRMKQAARELKRETRELAARERLRRQSQATAAEFQTEERTMDANDCTLPLGLFLGSI